jgi:hypothetical protein
MDARDVAANTPKWYNSFDSSKMIVEVYLYDDDDTEICLEFPVVYEVCPLCEGNGTHVNPSIDSHGISSCEFAEDPEFEEGYFRGAYDVACYECGGIRVVPTLDEQACDKELLVKFKLQQEQDARYRNEAYAERMMEMRMGGCY